MAEKSYSGARVLVTGGTSGIGAGIAAAYADAGAEVMITGTRASPSDYDTDLTRYSYRQFNIEDRAQIARLADEIKALDILVNNGAIALASIGLDEWEPDNFERAITMHLTGVYRLSAALKDKLATSRLVGGASIIGIGSMSSFFGIEVVPGYGSGKTGLLGLTRVMAVAWAKHNIRVNAVAPALIESRQTAEAIKAPEMIQRSLSRTPLGRFGTPADVAGPVLFLSSPAASYITGQVLPVCGGFSIAG